jgi:hypothetical protein
MLFTRVTKNPDVQTIIVSSERVEFGAAKDFVLLDSSTDICGKEGQEASGRCRGTRVGRAITQIVDERAGL